MTTQCIDDETVLRLVEGRLIATTLAAVEHHLDACATCRDVIAQVSRARSSSHILERGAVLGRYVIGELLGSGAMGRVYSAWQPELDRRVAIKTLHEDAPGARERLVREARAMARLDHPNVVGVHEVGTTEDGVFVAMDLVEGDTLRTWVDRPRPWRDVARVLLDVARGLVAVHAAGVVHRDVKPDNVIVGADGRARLGDFGLARAGRSVPVDQPPPEHPIAIGTRPDGSLTRVAGTPAYMAPEVLRGGTATAASDQFGFGITAYEVLAGERPFAGRTWSELARTIERGAVPPLRSFPGWLDAAVRRCLAVEPARRFASLAVVAELLAERTARRRSTLWIAGATAAAVASAVTWLVVAKSPSAIGPSCELGGSTIATVWNPKVRTELMDLGPAAAAIDSWTASWAKEHDAACTASRFEPAVTFAARQRCLDRQRTELDALLGAARSSADRMIADRLIDALAALSPSECRDAQPGAADPVPLDPERARAVRDVERDLPPIRAAIALGDARPVVATSATLVERARASGHSPTLAGALLVHAETLRATSQLGAAAIAARDAAAAAERGRDDDTAARAWIARVAIAGDRRELVEADDLAAIALAAIDRAGSPPRWLAQLLRLRALVAYNRGRLDEARALLVDASARFAALSGERSLEVAAVEASLGSVDRAAGDLDAAERHHRAALAIDRAQRGARHPDIARDLHNLAGVLRLRGDLDAAAATYGEALAIEIATRGETSVEVGLTRNSLALIKMARRDWVDARTELERALDHLAAAGHGDRAFAEHNLGIVAAATGNHVEALVRYERAAAIYTATIGADAQAPIRLHLDRARSLAARFQIAAARDEARLAATSARAAGIDWIEHDARSFLDANLPPRPAIAVEPSPARQPTHLPEPTPRPKPRRDVGTYGPSQN